MNAMEHGNHYQAELPVFIEVAASDAELSVKITDEGVAAHLHPGDARSSAAGGHADPARLGLFLKSMVDEMNVTGDEHHHTVERISYRREEGGR